MNKKLLIIPAVALILTACGGGNNSSSQSVSKSSEPVSSSAVSSSQASSSSEEPTELKIVSQPQSVEKENGTPLSLSVEVNNPKLVKSYQWYYALYEDGKYEYQMPLSGSKALSANYSLPAHYSSSQLIEAYQCEIVDIHGKVLESNWALVTTKPGKDYMFRCLLGDYPILPGKTLDLKDTPYGSGTISLNEAGDHFLFKDVSFTNEHFDSNAQAIAFDMTAYNPDITNFILEFEGVNNFSNVYWEEDRFEGGASIILSALKLDQGKRITATFTGSGSLTFTGGSYGILTNFMDVIQDIDMSFYSLSGRYTGGIYCDGYTLNSNTCLTASLNKRLIDAKYDVTFKENSRVYANFNVAAAGSKGAVGVVDTTGSIYIKEADVKVNMALNVIKEIEEEIFISTWAFSSDEEAIIEDSNVDIQIKEYNPSPVYPEFFVTSATSGAFSGEYVSFVNSKINVEIDGNFINEARGVNTTACSVTNSEVNFKIKAKTAGGFCCYTTKKDVEAPFECTNSNIKIDVFNVDLALEPLTDIPPFDNGGIYASKITLSSNSRHVIDIKTNGLTTIALRTRGSETSVLPHEGYTDEFIKFEKATITSTTPFVHNEQSYSSAGLVRNVVFESLYEDLGEGFYKLIDNVEISYYAK